MVLNPEVDLVGISLWQPWASLFACGVKRCETRGRPMPNHYRGEILAVHAAEKMPSYDGIINTRLDRICRDRFGSCWYTELPRGAILGTVRMVASYGVEHWDEFIRAYGDRISDDERVMGDYSKGRYLWHAGHARPLARSFKFAGKQGFFKVPDRVAVQVLLAR